MVTGRFNTKALVLTGAGSAPGYLGGVSIHSSHQSIHPAPGHLSAPLLQMLSQPLCQMLPQFFPPTAPSPVTWVTGLQPLVLQVGLEDTTLQVPFRARLGEPLPKDPLKQ